ncbi:MAG: Rab family GTPase [Promethearchaeota archaeon]
MPKKIITGVIYMEMSDDLGPNPVAWLPTTFSQMDLLHISIKTLTVLTGEKGLVPESLVILPFPSLNSKGLIKYIKWEDPSRRGNIGQSAIGLFFEEVDDVIFYKYMNQLSVPFDEIATEILNLEKKESPREEFVQVLEDLEKSISSLLEELKTQEMTQVGGEQFPDQQVIDRNLIDYQFKIIIVGDPSVGKTSLILRYTNNAFRRSYVPTLGVHVSSKIFKIENAIIQLALWDIGGQEKFQTMRQQFYRGSDAVFLIFDLTKPESFNNIPRWFSDVLAQLKNRSEELIGFIVGNKKDLTDLRKISADMADKLASQLSLRFIETSALSGENVDYAFSTIATLLYKSRLES